MPTEVAASGLTLGSSYTLETLIRATIVSSDNLAYYILTRHLMDRPDGKMRFERTMQEIGMIDPKSLSDETVSARGYAALFRMLYSASYLDVPTSERVLSWLGEARFDKGLATGVPREVVVSNKFGERILDDGEKQLHDCGVIYLSKHPYSLCVMTRGRDFAELRKTVSEISEVVYEYVGRAPTSG